MTKGVNNAAARSSLLKIVRISIEKVEEARRPLTKEEIAFQARQKLIEEEKKYRERIDELRKEFEVGQLVWTEVRCWNNAFDIENTENGSRCCRIISIPVEDDIVETEMLYVLVDNEKRYEYMDWFGDVTKKGDKISFYFPSLEKHISKKTGNVWWRY